jgi:hypothetical protein
MAMLFILQFSSSTTLKNSHRIEGNGLLTVTIEETVE